MKQPSPNYQIGDVVPIPDDASIPLAVALMAKRGLLARRAKSVSRNQHFAAARKIMDGLVENERRRTDPFEQAKTFLRHRGFTPVCKVEKQYLVGRHRFASEAEVMEFAKRRGWEP